MIEVTVYSHAVDLEKNNKALCKRVDWSDSLQFPFEHTIKAFKALYGDRCIINFQVV